MWHLCSLTVHFGKKIQTLDTTCHKKRLSLAVFHNFDTRDASCRVFPWCKKHYLSMHFESGQLNSRGDVLRRGSQCWHLTDIHQLHNANADWLAAPPPTLLPQREKVPQFHCHFLTETQGIKKECLDGYVELNILGAGIHRSPPRCFLKHCKHNSDRFLDLWESCLRFVGRNNRRQ